MHNTTPTKKVSRFRVSCNSFNICRMETCFSWILFAMLHSCLNNSEISCHLPATKFNTLIHLNKPIKLKTATYSNTRTPLNIDNQIDHCDKIEHIYTIEHINIVKHINTITNCNKLNSAKQLHTYIHKIKQSKQM